MTDKKPFEVTVVRGDGTVRCFELRRKKVQLRIRVHPIYFFVPVGARPVTPEMHGMHEVKETPRGYMSLETTIEIARAMASQLSFTPEQAAESSGGLMARFNGLGSRETRELIRKITDELNRG